MVTTELRNTAGQVCWSMSRAKLFRECKRAYYYRYFLSQGGWRADAPALSQKAYALGKMSSLPLLVGETVHLVIEGAVRSGEQNISENAMAARGREVFRRVVEASRAGRTPPLMESYYGPEPTAERLAECSDLVESCLRNLCRLPLWREVRAVGPGDRLVVEEFATFHVGNARAIVRPDLVYRRGGRLHLVDWKSGRPRASDRLQLACYALFAQYRWHLRPNEVVVCAAYLRDGAVSSGQASAAELSLARGVIESGHRELANAVPRDPLTQHPADFPPTTDTRACKWCNYRELCKRQNRVGGLAPPALTVLPMPRDGHRVHRPRPHTCHACGPAARRRHSGRHTRGWLLAPFSAFARRRPQDLHC